MPPTALHFLLLTFAGWVNRRQQEVVDYLVEENRVLREQLDCQLGGRRIRFTDDQRRRLAAKGKLVGRKLLHEYAGLVTPDTILRWYRKLIAKKYDGSAQRGPGRPSKPPETAALVVQLAYENPGWGYTRIRDVMRSLGHEIGRTTVAAILADHGIEPSPERGKKTSWRTFLKSHWEVLAAMDFFTVEVVTLHGLVRYSVLFVIELSTRNVQIAGITNQANDEWMRNMARHLTDGFDGFLLDKRYLILDRDPLFTRKFREILRGSGVEPLRLPARSPNLNAYAERVRTLDQVGVSRQDRAARRTAPSARHPRVRRALPPRASSPGARQLDRRSGGVGGSRWTDPTSRASRRNPKPLLPRGSMRTSAEFPDRTRCSHRARGAIVQWVDAWFSRRSPITPAPLPTRRGSGEQRDVHLPRSGCRRARARRACARRAA